jgi:hypothetical protein
MTPSLTCTTDSPTHRIHRCQNYHSISTRICPSKNKPKEKAEVVVLWHAQVQAGLVKQKEKTESLSRTTRSKYQEFI